MKKAPAADNLATGAFYPKTEVTPETTDSLSTVLAEALLKLLAGKVDTALHRPYREVHSLSDLLVLVALQIHAERVAILVLEIVDRLVDLRQREGAIRGGQPFAIAMGTKVGDVCIGVKDIPRPYRAVVVVDEEVAHDREDPALEIGILPVHLFIIQHFQRSVLQQILRFCGISCQRESEVVHIALQAQ